MAFTEKYVTPGGTEAWATNSSSNPSSLAEALSNVAGGERVNIKYDASGYSSASNLTQTNNGGATTPIAWRGYKTTIGDLDGLRDDPETSEITITDFPVLTLTSGASITFGSQTFVSNMRITGTPNGPVVLGFASGGMHNCSVYNSSVGSSARAIAAGFYSYVVGCDAELGSGADFRGAAIYMQRGVVSLCRIWNDGGGGIGVQADLTGSVIRCAFVNVDTGIQTSGSSVTLVQNCSFQDVADECMRHNNGTLVAINNAAWGDGGGTERFWDSDTGHHWLRVANAVGNNFASDSNPSDLDKLDEVTLTGDPFTSATDLSLNSTAGAGAACADAAVGTNLDIGAWQEAAGGGGGGSGGVKLAGSGGLAG